MGDDPFDSLFGRVYSAYMERSWLSRWISALVWGGDIRPYYASMGAIAALPAGATVVDCPCGAGPALRAMRPGQDLRYVALDRSPAMLRRARKRASARDLDQVELVEADATALPLPDASADLFLSYWGLHCFDDPRRAVLEVARALKPGARLVGASFVRGRGLRQRALVRPGVGGFGAVPYAREVEAWLDEAGLAAGRLEVLGPMLYFEATKEAGEREPQAAWRLPK
jgi:SAM-dependent methyltransferase